MKLLEGKVTLVTGAARGIGKAIALKFAEHGANVAFTDLQMDETALDVEAALASYGVKAKAFASNAADFADTHKVVEEIHKAFGKIDVLVNNAGRSYVGLFSEMKPEEVAGVISVNLLSTMYCSRLCVPQMVRRCRGSIINISSMWGISGASCEAVYSGAKGGINAFTKALARELGPSSVRVNAISCGVIETGMNSFLSDQEAADLAHRVPLSRFGTAAEVAEAAAFLASDSASYITGQILGVDGGMI